MPLLIQICIPSISATLPNSSPCPIYLLRIVQMNRIENCKTNKRRIRDNMKASAKTGSHRKNQRWRCRITVDDFLVLLKCVRSVGTNNAIGFPAHDDRRPSLSVRLVDNRVFLKCRVGCTAKQICAARNINLADLFTTSSSTRWIELEARLRDDGDGSEL